MESLYDEAEAQKAVEERKQPTSELLALRTYTARLLGREPCLALHGGGNTSVKAQASTVFGETIDVLYVKGSGRDLATIEPSGQPAVRMDVLRRLLSLTELSDEKMHNELRLALLDASAPTPSVETLLHAALPARFVDHAHADAVLAVVDQEDAERICRSIYGEGLLYIPYVAPGFALAKSCKRALDAALAAGRSPTVMILERHGVFTFGDTAKESYERMIDVVTRAERYAADAARTEDFPAIACDEALEAKVSAVLRGAYAAVAREPVERGPILSVRSDEWILAFLERANAAELVERGCATPDRVLRTKPAPLFLAKPDYADQVTLAARLEEEIAEYAKRYDKYFEAMRAKKGVTRKKNDPWPRVVLAPKVGILAIGRTKKEAEIVADLYQHTIQVIADAEQVGRYSPASRDDLFDVEYGSLEQAKIEKAAEPPLARSIAVVTGAASGIGKATASLFLDLGAHVVLSDRREDALVAAVGELGAERKSQVAWCVADVTKREDVQGLFSLAARLFGGVDVVVSNAGGPGEGRLDTDEGDAALRASLELNFLAHNLVASCASEVMRRARRGGCILFNASKSAFAPSAGFGPYAVAKAALVALMRQHAIDLARFGIRANAVNADRVRTGIFAGGLMEARAAARGLSVDEYFRANMLAREVTARDVASAFAWLAQAPATTGCVVTVDGGNAAAFPR